MADEAVLKGRMSGPINMTVGDAHPGLEKGTLMQLSIDPRTVQASSAADVFGGVLAREKVASDGRTSVPCFQDGIFDLTINALAGITQGAQVALSGVNVIKAAVAADLLTGAAFGKALETGSASEVIEVLIGRGM